MKYISHPIVATYKKLMMVGNLSSQRDYNNLAQTMRTSPHGTPPIATYSGDRGLSVLCSIDFLIWAISDINANAFQKNCDFWSPHLPHPTTSCPSSTPGWWWYKLSLYYLLMNSTNQRLCDQVSKDELFENRDIPKVDKE